MPTEAAGKEGTTCDETRQLTWPKPSQLKFSPPAVAAAMAAFVFTLNTPIVFAISSYGSDPVGT